MIPLKVATRGPAAYPHAPEGLRPGAALQAASIVLRIMAFSWLLLFPPLLEVSVDPRPDRHAEGLGVTSRQRRSVESGLRGQACQRRVGHGLGNKQRPHRQPGDQIPAHPRSLVAWQLLQDGHSRLREYSQAVLVLRLAYHDETMLIAGCFPFAPDDARPKRGF